MNLRKVTADPDYIPKIESLPECCQRDAIPIRCRGPFFHGRVYSHKCKCPACGNTFQIIEWRKCSQIDIMIVDTGGATTERNQKNNHNTSCQ